MRDFQKARVYRWEDTHIAPRDQSQVPFEHIQAIVNHCWPVQHPPRVLALPKQARVLGTGHRLGLRFPSNTTTPTWVILHELAHALTYGDGHGPNYVGVYMQLVEKYLNVPLPFLHYTAKMGRVKFSLSPTFNLSGEYA